MRTCPACGFENAEIGKPCPLCGQSEVTTRAAPFEEASTLELEPTLTGPARCPRPPTAIGRVFGDRYRADARLGAGGMGEVFRARDLVEERDVALKTLHPSDEDDADRNQRFKREISVLSKIHHPAVPRILGFGTHEGRLYFVSELVEGTNLKLEIQAHGAWDTAKAAALCATVADALASAHAVGVVHRDVKPSNIMLGTDGSVRLLDFGLARGVGIDMATLTRTGTIVGTPGYMSPEQFEGLSVDERTDIYSLGVVLFELLTARLPFLARTPMAVAIKHRTEPPPLPRTLRPEVPAWLERIVLRCLEKDPAARFTSAAELACGLRPSRPGRPARSRRLPTGDHVLEDDSESTDWALVLGCPSEKTGWETGLALRFQERFFRLGRIDPPSPETPGWTYRFEVWPESEILRQFVDYEKDSAERAAVRERSLSSRLQRWISGGKE
jgi:serine/threonine protein kinase